MGECPRSTMLSPSGLWWCAREKGGGRGEAAACVAAWVSGLRSRKQRALVVPRGGLGPAGVSRGQPWRCFGGASVLPAPRGGSPGGASGGLRSCRRLAGTNRCDCDQGPPAFAVAWRLHTGVFPRGLVAADAGVHRGSSPLYSADH